MKKIKEKIRESRESSKRKKSEKREKVRKEKNQRKERKFKKKIFDVPIYIKKLCNCISIDSDVS